jgi:hypothetical protein
MERKSEDKFKKGDRKEKRAEVRERIGSPAPTGESLMMSSPTQPPPSQPTRSSKPGNGSALLSDHAPSSSSLRLNPIIGGEEKEEGGRSEILWRRFC